MQLRIDTKQWERAMAELGEKNALRAGARAINRTLANAKTASVKVVAKDMKLKQAHVRERITIRKASPAKPIGYLDATIKRTPMILFSAKGPEPSLGKGRGVTVKLPTSAGRYPHAFIATMKSGHRGVFMRKRTGQKTRLPIRQLYGPSVAQSFTRNSAEPTARATEMLAKNMAHEVKYLLTKATQK